MSIKYRRIILTNQSIGLMSKVFANGTGEQGSVPRGVIAKTQKGLLDAT